MVGTLEVDVRFWFNKKWWNAASLQQSAYIMQKSADLKISIVTKHKLH